MELRDYIDKGERGATAALAASLGISVVYLLQLAARQNGRVPSAELCVRIEVETGGSVTRRDLRRDDWHRIWPELVKAEQKAA